VALQERGQLMKILLWQQKNLGTSETDPLCRARIRRS